MNILIIKPSSFGDIVQANPVATALKQAFPNCSICWVVFDKFVPVVELFANIDNKVIWKRNGGLKDFFSVASQLRKMDFDVAIDLQGLFRTALLARLSGAKKVIGVPGMKEFSYILVKEVFAYSAKSGLNAVIRNLETVRFLTEKSFKPQFSLSLSQSTVKLCQEKFSSLKSNNEQKIIGVVTSARGIGKNWALKNYEVVINSILNKFQNTKVILLGLDNKLALNNDRVINLQGQTTIAELAYLLKECSLVFGGDTGPVHLASALGVKVVMLFGASDVNETAPIAKNAVILHKMLPCSPCRGRAKCKDFKCINSITANEVISAIESNCELK
ncbi:MAG: glycosyltransferase family 9 protein [Endomicrobiales bacterium]|nr:glycosyltransferase family 9 protein [Endomicrobiales bacterium]